jgi:hypothetical protein
MKVSSFSPSFRRKSAKRYTLTILLNKLSKSFQKDGQKTPLSETREIETQKEIERCREEE